MTTSQKGSSEDVSVPELRSVSLSNQPVHKINWKFSALIVNSPAERNFDSRFSRFSELAELKLKWRTPLLDASQWAFIGSRVPEDGVTSLSRPWRSRRRPVESLDRRNGSALRLLRS